MIDEPVPTMPEIVPAISPTMRTKRKPNLTPFAIPDADIMVAAGYFDLDAVPVTVIDGKNL
jgi:hypothetical protein